MLTIDSEQENRILMWSLRLKPEVSMVFCEYPSILNKFRPPSQIKCHHNPCRDKRNKIQDKSD